MYGADISLELVGPCKSNRAAIYMLRLASPIRRHDKSAMYKRKKHCLVDVYSFSFLKLTQLHSHLSCASARISSSP